MALTCCPPHWSALRKEIDDRGLGHLVAQGGKEAVDRLLEGSQAPAGDLAAAAQTFDPLMGAWLRVTGAFIENAGLGCMMGEQKVCPFCDVEKQTAGLAQNWLTGVADEALDQARVLGLVPPKQ